MLFPIWELRKLTLKDYTKFRQYWGNGYHQKVHGISFASIWNRLPFPSPGALPDPGVEPMSPALADGFFTTELPVKQYC